ncbi:MAG: alpha/beta hydrolase [Bacteroidetes bacterium]|nr:alpha/beta hydrolase [Bacteroidota bacterium]
MTLYDYLKPVPENLQIHESNDFKYIDSCQPSQLPPVVFLHGLLGNIDCWYDTASAVANEGYRAIIPFIPIDKMPRGHANIDGIANYVESLFQHMNLHQIVLIGNSLGGQIAVRYTSKNLNSIIALVLSGSSGIYETDVGKTSFRRNDREFIRKKAEMTFYDPKMVNDDLVERIFNISTNRSRAIRFIWAARSSMNDLIIDELKDLNIPASIIWGLDDQITPSMVAHQFHEHLPNSELHFIKECGHAPMMEYPELFNELLIDFLNCTLKNTPAEVEA